MPCNGFDCVFGGVGPLSNRKLGFCHGRAHVTPRYASDGSRLRYFLNCSVVDARQISDCHLCRRANQLVGIIRKILNHLQVVG